MLTKVRTNYLLIGNSLVMNSLVFSDKLTIQAGADPMCDSLASPQTCLYNKALNIVLPSVFYKIYLSISGLSL